MYLYIDSHPRLVVLCKFNTVSEHFSQCFVSLFAVVSHYLNVTFFFIFVPFCFLYVVLHQYAMLLFVDSKHAIVYFCIICKLIKKSFFFPYENVYCTAKKVASYSEYFVEVDFLRI